MPSPTVENYIKAIYKHSLKNTSGASTNILAEELGTKAATVSDMLKKLADKKLINYKKYQGVTLTIKGRAMAVGIVRKHRLWEVFLVDKLHFKWDEVHEIAEELEHIESTDLINRLEEFLDHPKFDPHGDPIPDIEGNIPKPDHVLLSDLKESETGIVTGVKDSSKAFLQFLESQNLVLGTSVSVKQIFDYDNSRQLEIGGQTSKSFSYQVCKNLLVKVV